MCIRDSVSEGLHKERKDVVILTRVESDQLTSNLSGFAGLVVEKVNDTDIKSLKELHEILHQENPPEFITIEFAGGSRPLVIPSADAAAAHPRIMKQVGISREAILD